VCKAARGGNKLTRGTFFALPAVTLLKEAPEAEITRDLRVTLAHTESPDWKRVIIIKCIIINCIIISINLHRQIQAHPPNIKCIQYPTTVNEACLYARTAIAAAV
jgi:hypothetical protein